MLTLLALGGEALWGQLALLGDSQLTRPGAGSCSQLSAGRAPQALASSYHSCLVEKWVGPKEQIYCVSSALGSVPGAELER